MTTRRRFVPVRPLALAALLLAAAMAAPAAGGPDGPGQKAPASPAAVPPRALTAHLVGHAHIDLSWLWRWEETVADIAMFTFRGTLDQMDKVPGLTFAQSQAAIYEAVEKEAPGLFARIAAKIKEGAWVPVGGMWVEPDANMPDGEALARQLLYGAGDHGGGPRDADLAAIVKYKDDPNEPRLVFDTPGPFLASAAADGAAYPVVKRELNFTFPACYTTQAAAKKSNRQMEALLLTAEKFSVLAAASGYRDYYPERDLDEAWKIVLRNQFHDILDGSSIGPVYDEVAGFYRQARARAERALDFSLETISARIDTRGPGLPVVVYNPLFWDRTEPVQAEIAVPPEAAAAMPRGGGLRLTDAAGRDVPVQVLEKRERNGQTTFRVVFLAEAVPSLGYRLYRALPGAAAPAAAAGPAALAAGPGELENEFLRVRLDPKTGWIAGLYDKTARREGLAGRVGEAGATVELVENGPVRAVLRVKSRFRDSTFEQDLVLVRGLPRLDCLTRVDWRERNIMIKAAFPLALRDPVARFEIPYGSIVRPADGTEVPALRWIDVADGTGAYGAALLNDSKYGFDVQGGTMRLSVVHGATYPDPEADRGRHELLYAILPHHGDWRAAEVTRRGLELNSPLLARTPLVHTGELPPARSFIRVSPANAVLSAFKKEMGYAERGLVLRLYETAGEKTVARIELPWAVEAFEADLIERPNGPALGSGPALSVTLGPYEIKTIRVVRK